MAQFAGGGTRLLETQRPFTPLEDPRFSLFVTGIRLDPLPRQRQSESGILPPLRGIHDVPDSRQRRNTLNDVTSLGFRKLPSIRSAPVQGTRSPCTPRACVSAHASARGAGVKEPEVPRVKKGAWLSTSSASVSSLDSESTTDAFDRSEELLNLGLQQALEELTRVNDVGPILRVLRQILENFTPQQRKHSKKSVVACLANLSVHEQSTVAAILQIVLLVKSYAVFFRWYYKQISLDKNFAEATEYLLDPFLEALGSLTPIEDSESCTFAYECLRIVAGRHPTRSKLQDKGAIELLILHLQLINAQKRERGVSGLTTAALVELLRAVRILAVEDENDDDDLEPKPLPKLQDSVLISEIVKTLKGFIADVTVVLHLSRLMSFTSAEDSLCNQYLNHSEIFSLCSAVVEKYPGMQKIVVRITFFLGNLVSVDDRSRERFVESETNVTSLLHIFNVYVEKLDQDTNDVSDLLVKVLRIVANLSLTPNVGFLLCQSQTLLDLLLYCLRNCQRQRRSDNNNSFRSDDDYVNAVLFTLNNITYYESAAQHSIWKEDPTLVRLLISFITQRDGLSTCTALRVLANVSRWSYARNSIVFSLDAILSLLGGEREVAQLAIGICVNLTSDSALHEALQRKGIIIRLISVLKSIHSPAEGSDVNWMLAVLALQCLWNLMSRNAQLVISGTQVNELMDVLLDLMDEELQLSKGTLKELPQREMYETEAGNDVLAEILVWEEFTVLAGTVYDTCASGRFDVCA